MKPILANRNFSKLHWIVAAAASTFLLSPLTLAAQEAAAKTASAAAPVGTRVFETPQLAADALITAADKFDVGALEEIFGPDGDDIVLSGEYPQDRQ